MLVRLSRRLVVAGGQQHEISSLIPIQETQISLGNVQINPLVSLFDTGSAIDQAGHCEAKHGVKVIPQLPGG